MYRALRAIARRIWRLKALSPINYLIEKWCPGADLNHRHEDFQSTALPLSYPGLHETTR